METDCFLEDRSKLNYFFLSSRTQQNKFQVTIQHADRSYNERKRMTEKKKLEMSLYRSDDGKGNLSDM